MIFGRSVLGQVGGLALAALLAVLLVSFGIVLLSPDPAAPRMKVADAAAALREPARAGELGLGIIRGGDLPAARQTTLVASAVADALGVQKSRVGAWWSGDRAAATGDTHLGQTVMVIAGQDAVVERTPGGFTLASGTAARLSPDASIPPFSAALLLEDGRWIVVAPKEPLVAGWRLRMLAAFLIGALILAPLAWLIARRLTRPIRRLAEAAERARLWQQEEPPAIEGPREIAAAARAISAMRRRLAAEAAQRTRMLAAVAHDLRNPLTGLRLRAEAAPEPGRARMVADIDRMEAMIAQVLDYAKGRETREPVSAVDLARLVRGCALDAVDRGDDVALGAVPRSCIFECEAEGVRRALDNLVGNAVRYAGSARLSLTCEGGEAVVAVEDDGPGLPADEVGRLLEPFERLETSRSRSTGGTGLGLAIAREAAERHGGSLTLENREGRGLSAKLRLQMRGPRRSPSDAPATRPHSSPS